jgi:hypothetical protein
MSESTQALQSDLGGSNLAKACAVKMGMQVQHRKKSTGQLFLQPAQTTRQCKPAAQSNTMSFRAQP